jgi:GTP-binding protein HflX
MEIFHRHAHSREAKLQVEIARLKYVSPRLRESLSGGGRQQGSGAGESDLDLDRRKIRDRLAELKEQLEDVWRDNDQRRSARRDQLRVALVGYTNAGKSSLMRALTGSEVLVADKLFATLDTTVRALKPETKPRVLVSDTVGFIKKLPHDLVASFRSTLAEALETSLLLFVVDASDPTYESQIEVSRNVLREIGAEVVPSRLLLNKIDRVSEADRASLRAKHPDAILLSAKSPEDVAAARDDHRVLRSCNGGGPDRAALRETEAARRCVREHARALRGLRRHRPDHEGAGSARRHRAPAKNPRHFVSSIADRSATS